VAGATSDKPALGLARGRRSSEGPARSKAQGTTRPDGSGAKARVSAFRIYLSFEKIESLVTRLKRALLHQLATCSCPMAASRYAPDTS